MEFGSLGCKEGKKRGYQKKEGPKKAIYRRQQAKAKAKSSQFESLLKSCWAT